MVASINEQEGIATVKFPPTSIDCRKTSQASDILTIPLSRLCVPRSEVRSSQNPTLGIIVGCNAVVLSYEHHCWRGLFGCVVVLLFVVIGCLWGNLSIDEGSLKALPT